MIFKRSSSPLVGARDLARLTSEEPSLRIFDVSWYQAVEARDPPAEFEAGHIPGARFVPLGMLGRDDTDLPHMCPKEPELARIFGELGVAADTPVVAYDKTGFRSAARVWWLLRLLGHRRVAVLDGGFPAWEKARMPVAVGKGTVADAVEYRAATPLVERVDFETVKAAIGDAAQPIIDARPASRFSGAVSEPRPGMRSGHIPGSVNAELNCFIDERTGTVLGPDRLAAIFDGLGVDADKRAIVTCGSGVAASGLALLLETIGISSRLYDGSWSEWITLEDAPIAHPKARDMA